MSMVSFQTLCPAVMVNCQGVWWVCIYFQSCMWGFTPFGVSYAFILTTANPRALVWWYVQSVHVQFSSIQDGVHALRKACMFSLLSLRCFWKVAFETVSIFVWLVIALSHPFIENCQSLGRLSTASSFYTSLLQSVVLGCCCFFNVSSFSTPGICWNHKTTCSSCFAHQSIFSVIFLNSNLSRTVHVLPCLAVFSGMKVQNPVALICFRREPAAVCQELEDWSRADTHGAVCPQWGLFLHHGLTGNSE